MGPVERSIRSIFALSIAASCAGFLWRPGLKALQCALSDGERGFRQTINEFVETRAVGHGSIVFTVVLSANRK
jgi:hypothetical protein